MSIVFPLTISISNLKITLIEQISNRSGACYLFHASRQWHVADIFACNGTMKWRRLCACVCLNVCVLTRAGKTKNSIFKKRRTFSITFWKGTKISLNVAGTHSPAVSASDFEGLKSFWLNLKISWRIILCTLYGFKIFISSGDGGGWIFFIIIKWNIIIFFSTSLQSYGNVRCFNISLSRKIILFISNVLYIYVLEIKRIYWQCAD